MSRPLMNFSIIELTEQFVSANGSINTILDLIRELRHRSTPKAVALNQQALAVIGQNPSARTIQSLLLPELEYLVALSQDNPPLRVALMEVLQTRNSVKAQKLLEKISGRKEIAAGEDIAASSALESSFQNNSVPLNETESISHKAGLFAAIAPVTTTFITTPPEITQIVPQHVEQAFALFGLPVNTPWSQVERSRQKLVFKYRPGAGIEKEAASKALLEISAAHAVLAEYMQNKI